MNKLMTAQEASLLAGKNRPDIALELILTWLEDIIYNACDNGKFKVEMDVYSWNTKTNSRGFEVKKILAEYEYKFEDYYETISDFDNHNKLLEIKKIRISWGDNNESK